MLRPHMCPARRPWRSISLLIILVVLAATTGAVASAQVATLSSPEPSAAAPAASPVPDGQQALLDWAECMRGQGVEMDDPRFGLEGELIGGLGKDGEGAKADAKSDAYAAANEVCGDLLTTFKAPADPESQAERAEALLTWASCMRAQGIDLPDPNPDGSFPAYDWKIDLKGEVYATADEACRDLYGGGGK